MLKVLREKRPDLKIPYGEDNILEPNKTEIDGNPIGTIILTYLFNLLFCVIMGVDIFRRTESPLFDPRYRGVIFFD